MARPWRIEFEDAVYHVTSRGNNRQKIFLDDEDRGFFLECLGRASQRFELDVLAFCLMDNHFHLFLRTQRPNLSRAMHWLNGTYTGHFNWRHKRCGHLLQGRYKSVLLADDEHYLHLSMYIHLNPVRAGLVEHPREYSWSSYRDYVNRKSRFAWLNREEILSHYGTRKLSRTRDYARECLGLIGKKPGFVDELKASAILGPREAVERIVAKYRPVGKAGDVAQYSEASKNRIDPHAQLERVAKIFCVQPEDLKRKRRNFPAKLAAYYHLVETCGLSATEASKILQTSTKAVSFGIRSCIAFINEDKSFQKKINSLSIN